MRVITQYALREFWRYFLLLLGIFLFVYLLVDFLDRVDNFIEYHSTAREVLAYYAFRMPWILLQSCAVAVLLAVIVSLSLMHRHNEITALKAAGISIFRLSLPFLLTALFISLITFVLSEGVVPLLNARAAQLWTYDMRHNEPENKAAFKRFKGWYRSERGIYQVRIIHGQDEVLEGVGLYFFDDDFHLTRRVDAWQGRYEDGEWTFIQGTDKVIGPDGLFKVDRFQRRTIFLPEKPADFAYTEKTADQMSLPELEAYIAQLRREGYETTAYQVDRQVKFSLPFVCTVLTLLAIPLTLRQSREASMARSVGLGVAVVFIYLVFFGLSRSLGQAGTLPVVLAAWLPNLVFGLSGAYLLVTLRQ